MTTPHEETYTFTSLYLSEEVTDEVAEEVTLLLQQLYPNLKRKIDRYAIRDFSTYGDLVVARLGTKIVGLGTLRLNFLLAEGRVGVIRDLIVAEEYRRRGIGEKIIRYLLAHAGIDDGTRTSVEVNHIWAFYSQDNEPAKALFLKLGIPLCNINCHCLALK